MSTSVRFDEALAEFVINIQNLEGTVAQEDGMFMDVNTGHTYSRIGFKDADGNEHGTYCFVVVKDTDKYHEGDILRRASDTAPAVGARGNIYELDMSKMTPEGPARNPVGRPKSAGSEKIVSVIEKAPDPVPA